MAKRHVNAVNQIDERIDLQRNAWLVTEAVLLAMNASLREIGSRRNRQIKKQHHTIIANRAELLRLLQLNSELENRVERASRLAALESEQFLHRVGADLHDGPAQLIGFALLHLSSLAPCLGEPDKVGEAMEIIAGIHGALAEAMDEVRSLCAGLTMPRIALLPIADALRSVIQEHEQRTGTVVRSDIAILPPDTPHFVKASLCRLVQEGLNNAYRHAGGQGQSVKAWTTGDAIAVEVADDGPGIAPLVSMGLQGGLGLVGLLNRIESLGGTMKILSIPSGGTRLRATMSTEASEGSAGE